MYKALFLSFMPIVVASSLLLSCDKDSKDDRTFAARPAFKLTVRVPDVKWDKKRVDTINVRVAVKSSIDEKEVTLPLQDLLKSPAQIELHAHEGELVQIQGSVLDRGIGDNPFLTLSNFGADQSCDVSPARMEGEVQIELPVCAFQIIIQDPPKHTPSADDFEKLVAECERVDKDAGSPLRDVYRSLRMDQTEFSLSFNKEPDFTGMRSCREGLEDILSHDHITINFQGDIDLTPLQHFNGLHMLSLTRTPDDFSKRQDLSVLKQLPELGSIMFEGFAFDAAQISGLGRLVRASFFNTDADLTRLSTDSQLIFLNLHNHALGASQVEEAFRLPRLRYLSVRDMRLENLDVPYDNQSIEVVDLYDVPRLKAIKIKKSRADLKIAVNENAPIEAPAGCPENSLICKDKVLSKIQGFYGWDKPMLKIAGNRWFEYHFKSGSPVDGIQQFRPLVYDIQPLEGERIKLSRVDALSCPFPGSKPTFEYELGINRFDEITIDRTVINHMGIDAFGLSEPGLSLWALEVKEFQSTCEAF